MKGASQKVIIYGILDEPGQRLLSNLRAKPERFEVHGFVSQTTQWSFEQRLAGLALPADRLRVASWDDPEALVEALRDMDVLIHVAGPFRYVERNRSDVGLSRTRKILDAAKKAGVKRIVFASTVWVLWGMTTKAPYREILRGSTSEFPSMWAMVPADADPQPVDSWASTRVWEETLARHAASQSDVSVVCVRLGWVGKRPSDPGLASVWCSVSDAAQILERAAVARLTESLVTVAGISANRYRWIEIDTATKRLGYVPLDGAGARGIAVEGLKDLAPSLV